MLKDLGFKVDKYVASEICEDSIAVSRINHEGKITHVDDVRFITEEQVDTLSIHSPFFVGLKGWSPMVGPQWLVPNGWSPVVGPQWLVPNGWSPMVGPQWLVPNGWFH